MSKHSRLLRSLDQSLNPFWHSLIIRHLVLFSTDHSKRCSLRHLDFVILSFERVLGVLLFDDLKLCLVLFLSSYIFPLSATCVQSKSAIFNCWQQV